MEQGLPLDDVGAVAQQDANVRAARPALRRLLTVAVVVALAWLLPYVHPSLEGWRYYDSFDASPLLRAATMQAPTAAGGAALAGLGGMGAMDGAEQPSDDELAALDDGLVGGAALELGAGGGGAVGVGSVGVAGPGADDGIDDEAELAGSAVEAGDVGVAGVAGDGGAAAGHVGAATDGIGPSARVGAGDVVAAPGAAGASAAAAPSAAPAVALAASAGIAGAAKAGGAAPAGSAVDADNTPPGTAALDPKGVGAPPVAIEHIERLKPFFDALRDLAHGKRSKVRARHYGDSHLANDGISHVLRVLLQRRFGDGGHGFVLAASRSKWYSHKGVRVESSDDWKSRSYLGGGFADDAYGYGGEGAQGSAGASVKVSTGAKGHGARAQRIELWWRGDGGAELAVELDGGKVAAIRAEDGKDVQSAWDKLADGGHRVRVRVTRGRPKIYGWVLERDRGLVWDSLGVVGARARRWLNSNAGHVAGQIRARGTDLLVINYGANSRNDKIGETKYAESFEKVIALLRPNGDEACLVLGPGDHGKREKGRVVSDQRTIEIIGWQRKVAARAGCAFFDIRAAMGGDGAMGRWVAEGLGWADYAHLTPRGQATLGKGLFQALMQGLRP